MAHRSGLGKGLEALIPGDDSQKEAGMASIPVDRIILNPHQPRTSLNPDDLSDLALSIKEHGILQPLIVSKTPGEDRYTLIAGERRLRAAQMAGLNSVPVIVRQASDEEFLELALIENVQRANLTPLETAEAYRQLNEDFGLSHESIAQQVGKSRVSVTNSIRLLKLPASVRAALAEGKISEGHARALLPLSSPSAQDAALQSIIRNNLTVRQTEELVQRLNGERISRTPHRSEISTPETKAMEERLRNRLGTRVNLLNGKNGGRLVIHYYSGEELDAIVAQILKE